jgi:UDPglucose 6-dehydrogenase
LAGNQKYLLRKDLKKPLIGLKSFNKYTKNMEAKFSSINDLKIGIIGVGMVGGALRQYFEKKKKKLLLYDKYKNIGSIEEVNQADIIFICVPTPHDKEKGFDLSFIEDACSMISGNKIIVIKSTVLPGTTEKLQAKYPQYKFLFNPEFLTEFSPDQDMAYPDRQIVGYTKQSFSVADDILQLLPLAPAMKILPAIEAEMVKFFGNTFLSTKIIFANQIYDLCQALGVNYDRIMECAGADKRIGRSHLKIWHCGKRGYAGKCLPKDIKAFIRFADEMGVDLKLHKIVDEINDKLLKEQGIEDPEKISKRE